MYIIGHIIIGTHLPWDSDSERLVALAHLKADPDMFSPFYEGAKAGGETSESMLEGLEDDDIDWRDLEWLDVVEDKYHWIREYHGSADSTVAWCGVELGQFNECDHFPVSKLTSILSKDVHGEHTAIAMERYLALPKEVRDVLPPFGTYVVWGSS